MRLPFIARAAIVVKALRKHRQNGLIESRKDLIKNELFIVFVNLESFGHIYLDLESRNSNARAPCEPGLGWGECRRVRLLLSGFFVDHSTQLGA